MLILENRFWKKQNLHQLIVASFNAQSVKGNNMACKRCEISTFVKDNGVDIFFVTETWLSAQGDEAKTVELAPSGFDVKSFPCQSRSRGGGIAAVCKATLSSNITFKTNFYFTHTSFKVVLASITLQHNTLTKQTLTTLSLYNLVQVINEPTHRCCHIIDWVVVGPDDDIHKNLLLQTHLNQTIITLNPTSMFQSLSLLPYTGLLGTWLTLTVHHLLLNFPVFHLLIRQTSSVTFCTMY